MRFVDEVTVRVQAGKGGDGCLSFHRGPNVPKGGPDGGNGGAGGNVLLVGREQINTLVDLGYRPLLRAKNGTPGGSQKKTGANGTDLVIPVPCGTTVVNEDTLLVLGDITEPGQEMLVAQGGSKGVGNAAFKSSTNRSPRRTTQGKPGEERSLRLQLKVLADVGLLGLPNAGKSTLISRVSQSKPKIADYPFTTLIPNLGVVHLDAYRSFVVADVPGLIEGASEGHGLGTRFLRHLSRTSLLLHLVDLAPVDGSDPIENVAAVENELVTFSSAFEALEIWLIGTKVDALGASRTEESLSSLKKSFPNRQVRGISAISGEGIDRLVQDLGDAVEQMRKNPAEEGSLQDRFTNDILQHELLAQRNEQAAVEEEPEAEVVYTNE